MCSVIYSLDISEKEKSKESIDLESYTKYAELAKKEKDVIFGGRLAEYKYYDMDDVVKSALDCAKRVLD